MKQSSTLPSSSYPKPAIILHWYTGVFILFLFALGWYMVSIPKGVDPRGALFELHKSLGLIVAVLISLRIYWRITHRPPAYPPTMKAWECQVAKITHILLYIGMILMPISGYLSNSFSGYQTIFFGYPLPEWGWKEPTLYNFFKSAHIQISIGFAILIGLHISAALKHLVIEKDGIMQRMLGEKK